MALIRRHGLGRYAFVLFVLGLMAIACGSSGSTAVDRAALQASCILDSDCTSPLRCAFKTCHEECATSSDCYKDYGPLARCVIADKPFNVCQAPAESNCTVDTQCPGNEHCASDHECRDGCTADIQCVSGQVCVTGSCAEPKELVDGGLPPPAEGGAPVPNEGRTCVHATDCLDPLVCLGGLCTYQCKNDRDCAAGQYCETTRQLCLAVQSDGGGSVMGAGCDRASDCASPLVCLNAHCTYQCVEDRDCASGQTCTNHLCTGGGSSSGTTSSGMTSSGSPDDAGGSCVRNSDCAVPLFCLNSHCGPQCVVNRDCALGQFCAGDGTCQLVPNDGGGSSDGGGTASDGGGTTGEGCQRNSDCTVPLFCLSGHCGPQCISNRDCPSGQTCAANGTCHAATQDGSSCAPIDCASVGKNCGTILDGCGSTEECSKHPGTSMECDVGEICGGGGPNVCGTTQCIPKTCSQLGKDCGIVSDGCSGLLSCGVCPAGKTCGGSGTANVCGCVANNNGLCTGKCGSVLNNCQDAIDCGGCTGGQTCGAQTTNVCGCPTTTCPAGENCGTAPDGCGGTLNCGTCTIGGQTCGGGGTPNHCGAGGCTTTTCAAQGKNCGTISNGCNATLNCGTCNVPGQTCGGAGSPNVCGCQVKTCAQLDAQCGMVDNGCGTPIDCGSCIAPKTCGGNGAANHCGCTATTCAAQGKNCGTIPDGCGGLLSCGTCTGGQSCGVTTANICGTPGPVPSCSAPTSTTCGPTGTDNCCRTELVQGTLPNQPYLRSYKTPSPATSRYPAKVSSFNLDVYEVTIGRYRAFAQSMTTWAYSGQHPPTGAGTHSNISTTIGDGGPMTWQGAWNSQLPQDYADLTNRLQSCGDGLWTSSDAGIENYPVTCVNWYEAFAFCAWDGGRLPTWSEWDYAYHGGLEYRDYPWGNAAPDCNRDVYAGCNYPIRAGLAPNGDGKWGQRNMAGSLIEWNFDSTSAPQIPDCAGADCAYSGTNTFCGDDQRLINGGSYGNSLPMPSDWAGFVNGYNNRYWEETALENGSNNCNTDPVVRATNYGFRCARNL